MNAVSRMTVLEGDEFACIRIIGRANLHSSLDFKRVVGELSARGCIVFLIELSQCSLMDSTFLGVLAGIGLSLRNGNEAGDLRLELMNPNERIVELLETLGVIHLFRVSHGGRPDMEGEEREHVANARSKQELSRISLEAHQTLMNVNPENVAKFKDVARFLADEIRKS